jgi:hypothetical protein
LNQEYGIVKLDKQSLVPSLIGNEPEGKKYLKVFLLEPMTLLELRIIV